MDKEYPNTILFFNDRIIRTVFDGDANRKVYWFDCQNHYCQLNLHEYYERFYYWMKIFIPVEEWRIENNYSIQPRNWNKDIWTEFKLRFI